MLEKWKQLFSVFPSSDRNKLNNHEFTGSSSKSNKETLPAVHFEQVKGEWKTSYCDVLTFFLVFNFHAVGLITGCCCGLEHQQKPEIKSIIMQKRHIG